MVAKYEPLRLSMKSPISFLFNMKSSIDFFSSVLSEIHFNFLRNFLDGVYSGDRRACISGNHPESCLRDVVPIYDFSVV